MQCPACNCELHLLTDIINVFICNQCGCIHGECYLGESYNFVLPQMAFNAASLSRSVPYDLMCIGSTGMTRRHGWVDPKTKLII